MIIEILCNQQNRGGKRSASQIKYIVYHYTGNDGDSAAANAKYYRDNVVQASANYFVDDTDVYRSVPDLEIAWSVGGKKWADCSRTGGGSLYGIVTNANSISIEMCDTVRDGQIMATEQTLDRAAALGRELMEKYNIPPERVVRHFDVTGKHCPAYFMDKTKWSDFKKRIACNGGGNEVTKATAVIPVKNIKAIAIVFGNGRSLQQVKNDTNADYIINGGLYDMRTNRPNCHLKVNGEVQSTENWGAWGYQWDVGPDINMVAVPNNATMKNHITCVSLLTPWDGIDATLVYDKNALGGIRGRTAMALTNDNLILYCSKDGTGDAKTPEYLRQELYGMGAVTAMMLDSGGSSQCDLNGQTIISNRNVNNYICVWVKPWYEDAMEWAKNEGLMDGTRALDYVTRAEVATLLHKLKLKL